MIKLLIVAVIVFILPLGIVAARLLWKFGNLKLKQMEDKHYDRYLDK